MISKIISKRELKLQANLKALVQRILISDFHYESEMDRYEKLLREMYELGIEPSILLKRKDGKNDKK